MSTCIGVNCYEQVTKDDTLYFIQSNMFKYDKLSEETDANTLMQMSDFAFNIVKSKYGTKELFKCK